jgi:hypothetical protein
MSDEHTDEDNMERPALKLLPLDRRPAGKTACETCAWANWFATESALSCYCRVMYMLTWPAEPAKVVKLCDGQLEPPEK